MKIEVWNDIPGYEGLYQASTFGRIKGLIRGKILSPSLNRGYLRVILFKDNIKKCYTIHQLVAITFLNHKPDGTKNIIVDHIDNDKLNNRLNNLQLINQRLNCIKDKLNNGISFDKSRNKWLAKIDINNKKIFLCRSCDKQYVLNIYITDGYLRSVGHYTTKDY